MFGRIRWQIAVPYVLLILAVAVVLTAYLSGFLRHAYQQWLVNQLIAQARLLADLLAQAGSPEAWDALIDRYARQVDVRVTLIALNGQVIGESHAAWREMENHLDRPEVQQALAKGWGSSIRMSDTLRQQMLYVAVDARQTETTLGVVRLAMPLGQVEAQIVRLGRGVLLVASVTAMLALLLAFLIAGFTVRPIHRMTELARRVADGDLGVRFYPVGGDEVGQLGRAFNEMTTRLAAQVAALDAQRDQMVAILDNMVGGVLIVSREGRVQLINPAAASLLHIERENALGRSVVQVLRHYELIELWQRCLDRNEEQSATVEVGWQGMFVQATICPLKMAGTIGYLVLLQDLTRIRRLETVRRDFISNISHELRTPLAGLKALVETLRDGALEDPPAARHFLERMEVEVDALTQMVEELLELARIESGRVPLRMQSTMVEEIIRPVMERLFPQAERKELAWRLDLPADLPAVLADLQRVQQVVTNLVHNAIKFTESGQIWVSGELVRVDERGQVHPSHIQLPPDNLKAGTWVLITVRDTGIGIDPDDLSRIFERFYKADRSRSSSGTGLGLSIARHIVQMHGGQIWAASPWIDPGSGARVHGSAFYFVLQPAEMKG